MSTYTNCVCSVGDVGQVLAEALHATTLGRPGPAYVDLPSNMLLSRPTTRLPKLEPGAVRENGPRITEARHAAQCAAGRLQNVCSTRLRASLQRNMQQGCENGPRSMKLVTPHKVLLRQHACKKWAAMFSLVRSFCKAHNHTAKTRQNRRDIPI